MKDYREIYGEAMNLLCETYGTPDYAASQENYFKVFEALATNGSRLVEISRSEAWELYAAFDQNWGGWSEQVRRLTKEIEILRRVNYARVDEWEQELQMLKDWLEVQAA